jgi:hypothetical protein
MVKVENVESGKWGEAEGMGQRAETSRSLQSQFSVADCNGRLQWQWAVAVAVAVGSGRWQFAVALGGGSGQFVVGASLCGISPEG